MRTIYIALGSNLSPRLSYLRNGILGLIQNGVKIQALSSVYHSSPVGNENQPFFLNAVAKGGTNLSPDDLLQVLLQIERENGRIRSIRWGERTLDLDLLLYDNLCMQSSDLILPHPRIMERKFVLIPLIEIAPNLRSPEGILYQKALDSLNSKQESNIQTIKCYRRSWFQENC